MMLRSLRAEELFVNKESIMGFIGGCVLTGAALGIYASGLKAELSAAKKDAEIQKRESQLQQTSSQHKEQSQLEQVSQQRDTCQARFQRATFLYEQPKNIFGTPFGTPERVWAIPADVEPEYGGSKHGLFSHYDPKTQMETVQFPAKTKQ
jgi:hypothetical protein